MVCTVAIIVKSENSMQNQGASNVLTPLTVGRVHSMRKIAEHRQKSTGFQTGKSLKALADCGFTAYGNDSLCIIFTH